MTISMTAATVCITYEILCMKTNYAKFFQLLSPISYYTCLKITARGA